MKKKKEFVKLFHHCMQVECVNEILYPHRFSKEMLDFYSNIDEGKLIRAYSTAGITMEFITDKPEISFRYKSKGFCRDKLAFDIYENDIFMKTIEEPERSETGFVCYKKQNINRVKITIFLPHCVWLGITDIDFGNWLPIDNLERTILFLGDSITQGMTVSSPSQAYPVLIARAMNCDYINQGVGGYVFCQDSIKDSICADRVIVAYGTNDFYMIKNGKMTVYDFQKNVEAYFSKIKILYYGTKITVITPIWRADCKEKDKEIFLKVKEIIEKCANDKAINVIDGLTLIGHEERFYVDGIHPNDWGANMMALNILRTLS